MAYWSAVRQSRRTHAFGARLESVQGGRLEPGRAEVRLRAAEQLVAKGRRAEADEPLHFTRKRDGGWERAALRPRTRFAQPF